MPYELDNEHYNDVITYSALDRYDYFLERIIANNELWTLKTDEGFVTIDNGDELPAIPFWPHPRYAEAYADPGSELFHIALDKLIENWLPGMKEEGRKAVVFPVADGESIFIETNKIYRDLREELENNPE